MTEVTLGELIRRRRREVGMMQAALGKLVGVRDTYISKIEVGTQRGSYETLAKIAMALKLPWRDMIATGEVKIPSLVDDLTGRADSLYPTLDQRFTQFHPKVKGMLYEIGIVLEKFVTGLPESDNYEEKILH